jgi:diguanylate cyclase (GGDEF)-like protein/PAS domain S-box-containing protein
VKDDDIIRLLVLDESSNEAERLISELRNAGFPIRATRVEDEEDLCNAIDDQAWDLMISSPVVGEFDAFKALKTLAHYERDIPFIIASKDYDPKMVIDGLKAGARSVVPIDYPELFLLAATRELADLKERRKRRSFENSFRESERRCRSLLDSSRDAISYLHEGMHLYANPIYLNMFGIHDTEEVEGMPVMDLVAPADHGKFKEILRRLGKGDNPQEAFEFRGLKLDGSEFQAIMEFSPASVEGEACTQIIIRDRSEDQELVKKLKSLSKQDLVTGLYNRQHLIEELDKTVGKAASNSEPSALLFIDLDRFDTVKEAVGLASSDLVLSDLASLLQKKVNDTGDTARFSDHTFAVLLHNCELEQAEALAEEIRKAMENHIADVSGRSVTTTCSIGISLIGENVDSAQQILDRADQACGRARDSGGNRINVFKPALSAEQAEEANERLAVEAVREALRSDRLRLLYQPIVPLQGEPKRFYETLIRLVDDNGELIRPDKFFDAVKQGQLLPTIDRWVLGNAMKRLARERNSGIDTQFFVKISGASLLDQTLLPWVSKALKSTRLQGDALIFEITESDALTHLKHAITFTKGCKQLHCAVALTRFGSSLNPFQHLKHLVVDYVKFDGTLMQNLTEDEKAQEQLHSYVEMAHSMGKLTIAEFIEDANSMTVLWHSGINYIQGNFIHPPEEELDFHFAEEER